MPTTTAFFKRARRTLATAKAHPKVKAAVARQLKDIDRERKRKRRTSR
jgi:hypothetical protein